MGVGAGHLRAAAVLGFAAALVPVLAWGASVGSVAGPWAALSLAADLLLVVGVPLLGAVLVLARQARAGLVVLVTFGLLQLPHALSSLYTSVTAGPALLPGLLAYSLPVAAGAVALRALADSTERPPSAGWTPARVLAASGLVAIALAALYPSVTIVGLEQGTATVQGAGGLAGVPMPHVLFAALYPLVLLALATGLPALSCPTAAAATGVVAAHAALMLAHVLLAWAEPMPSRTVSLVAEPVLAVQVLGVACLAGGGALLARRTTGAGLRRADR